MANLTRHIVGGGLGTFRAKDKAVWDKRQAALRAQEEAQIKAHNAEMMRAMFERSRV